MIRYSDITTTNGTTPEPGVYVTVKDIDGNLASLLDDSASPLSNPVLSGIGGVFYFNIADIDEGTYTLEFRLSLIESPRTVQVVYLGPNISASVALAAGYAHDAEDARDDARSARDDAFEALTDALDAEADAVAAKGGAESARDGALTYEESAGGIYDALLTALGGATFTGTLTVQADSIVTMALFTGMSAGKQVMVSEVGRMGLFVWDPTDLAAEVTSDPFEGLYVAPASAPTGASGAWVRRRFEPFVDDLRADWFGMPKDGSEIGAYAASMSALMSAQGGGGTIHLNGDGLYGVGTQIDNGPNAPEYGGGTARFAPLYGYTFLLDSCTKPVKIDGHGATIRCIAGKKFGAYEPGGAASSGITTTISKMSTPYYGMVRAIDCEALVEVEDVSLDGNVLNLVIGGQYGDTGWQIPAYGIRLDDCSGGVRVAYVNSHHHALDGLLINGLCTAETDPDENIVVEYCNIQCNGRNNISIIQGKGIDIRSTNHSWAGKAAVGSDTNGPTAMNPGAGVDVECEIGLIRDVQFNDCEATNCYGSCLTGIGNTNRVRWHRGKLVGSTNYVVWGQFAGLRFYDPMIVGHIANPYPNADPDLAMQIVGGVLTDDSDLSPTGLVWTMGGANTVIDAGGGGALNVLLENLTINITDPDRRLPYGGGFRMKNLRAKQISSETFYMGGTAEGTNIIESGGLWGGTPRVLNGETFYNGNNVLVQTISHNFGTLAAGASATVTFPNDGYANYLEIDGLQAAREVWLSPWPSGVVVEPTSTGGNSNIRVTNVAGGTLTLGTLTCMLKVRFFATLIEALP